MNSEAEVTTEAGREQIGTTLKRKVAIIGFAESSRNLAPFQDESFEIWGLNELYQQIPPRWHRWFQLHAREEYTKDFSDRDDEHIAFMNKMGIPIYMCRHYDDIPNSVAYPLEEVVEHFTLCPKIRECRAEGKRCLQCREWDAYFTNSISYMIALAIYEKYDVIHIYGVDMAQDTEYGHQKPSCEFFVGWARGAGIEVYLPLPSDLCKSFFYYGFEKENLMKKKYRVKREEMQERVKLHQKNMEELDKQMQNLQNQKIMQQRYMDVLTGGIQMNEYYEKNW